MTIQCLLRPYCEEAVNKKMENMKNRKYDSSGIIKRYIDAGGNMKIQGGPRLALGSACLGMG